MASAGVEVRTGRKWKAEKVVEEAESRLSLALVTGRAGLGYFPKTQLSQAQRKRETPATPG